MGEPLALRTNIALVSLANCGDCLALSLWIRGKVIWKIGRWPSPVMKIFATMCLSCTGLESMFALLEIFHVKFMISGKGFLDTLLGDSCQVRCLTDSDDGDMCAADKSVCDETSYG
jgi:hypothetical protein